MTPMLPMGYTCVIRVIISTFPIFPTVLSSSLLMSSLSFHIPIKSLQSSKEASYFLILHPCRREIGIVDFS